MAERDEAGAHAADAAARDGAAGDGSARDGTVTPDDAVTGDAVTGDAVSGAHAAGGIGRATPTKPDKGPQGFLSELVPQVAGFGVSFSTMFRKIYTEEYPEKPRPTQPRYHGRHQLNRHPDGLEKCIGCELCAWACPADAIYVEGADNTPDERFSPGERYGRVYQINYLRCIFCGLCIEACPTRALTMTNEYEMADDNRGKLIFEKEQLLAPLLAGMLPAPHPMPEGMDDQNYYRGDVVGVSDDQRAWADVHGHRPTQESEADTGPQTAGEVLGEEAHG